MSETTKKVAAETRRRTKLKREVEAKQKIRVTKALLSRYSRQTCYERTTYVSSCNRCGVCVNCKKHAAHNLRSEKVKAKFVPLTDEERSAVAAHMAKKRVYENLSTDPKNAWQREYRKRRRAEGKDKRPSKFEQKVGAVVEVTSNNKEATVAGR